MRWKRRIVYSDGLRLAVRDSGGEGKPVVLIHGLGVGQRSWDRVAPRLSRSGLRVVTYDQRGHGASDASNDYSLPAFEKDLAALSENLDLREPVLIGHSLGATIALGYAAARGGTASVICVDGGLPVVLPSADWDMMEAEMRRPLVRVGVWAMKVARLGAKLSFEELRRVVEEHDARINSLYGKYDCITCPVLMVVAAHADQVPQAEEIREAVREGVRSVQEAHPEVRVEWLPCGHNVPWERPAELADLIVRTTS
jgi:pimeloyl-ACP methyl ester carboxylesterase